MQNRALGRGHLERHIELTREGKEKKVTLNISNTALLLPCYTTDGKADVWHDRASDELLEMLLMLLLCRPAVVVVVVAVVKADSADNRAAASSDKQKLVNG